MMYSYPDGGNALIIRVNNQRRILIGKAPMKPRVRALGDSTQLPVKEHKWSEMRDITGVFFRLDMVSLQGLTA
jgi:hypothetical protein